MKILLFTIMAFILGGCASLKIAKQRNQACVDAMTNVNKWTQQLKAGQISFKDFEFQLQTQKECCVYIVK